MMCALNSLEDRLEIIMAKVSNTRLVWVLFAFVLINASASMAQTRRGVTPEDYFAFEFASDPNISPDGKVVVYVVTKIDRAQNRRNSSIWMANTDGSRAPWQFTTSPQSSNSPRWSPDGKSLAFLSSRPSESSAPAPAASPNPVAGPTPAAAAGAASSDQPRNQVYVLSMNGGEAKRNTDVWVINVDDSEKLTKISDHDEADNQPRWSPDGKWIAFTGELHDRDHPKIWLAPSTGGAASTLAANGLDFIPGQLEWSDDGKSIYFETGVKGENHLFRVDVPTKSVAQVTTGARAVRSVDFNFGSGKMVYLANDFKHLDDLFVADRNGRNEHKLTNLNEALWKQLQFAEVERFTYKGADDWDVDGFFVKPINWQAGKKYPLVLSIHGGPAGQYGVDWYHEFQVYAAKGYAVVFTNPRGSTGYGQKFERGIVNEWGGKDYLDIMHGLDAALKKYPWIDTELMGVTGGSYGGYMTNWIVGHTDRFKAAVTLRSVSNFISDDGTRDGAYGHSPDFGGDIFQKMDLYWDRSALKYARMVHTLTLVLHSDNDYRVPIEQGEQWFRALKHYGVNTEIVFFPRENHNLTRTGEPKHLVESLNWQLYWFDRFLNGNNNAMPPDQK